MFTNVYSFNQNIVSYSFVSFNVYCMIWNSHCLKLNVWTKILVWSWKFGLKSWKSPWTLNRKKRRKPHVPFWRTTARLYFSFNILRRRRPWNTFLPIFSAAPERDEKVSTEASSRRRTRGELSRRNDERLHEWKYGTHCSSPLKRQIKSKPIGNFIPQHCGVNHVCQE